MPVQEQKAAPKVHKVPPKAKQPTPQNDEPEETAPVATAVTLDQVEPEAPKETLDAADFESDADEEDTATLQTVDDDDDSDMSLLEDDEPVNKQPIVAEDDEPEEGFLEVYSENCLNCKSLVPFAAKKYKGCHFSAGNKHCPASDTQVVIRVPLEEIVPRFMAAEKDSDFHRLSKLNAKLAGKPEWYQQRVAQALREARSKQN